jgi:N-acetylglucosamine kinase-like BadF-type ATPase
MAYVIGADGGNSKTDLVLATDSGEVLARVTGAGTRPHVNGLPATVSGLAALARSAVAVAGLPDDTAIEVSSFYLANVDFADEEETMYAALTELRVADRVEVRNDTLAVLKAGSVRGWGVAVVAGAGINAVGVYPDGRQERFLGIGEMSGDWGGGYGVAVAALGAAVRAGDGRGEATALQELVVSTFGAEVESVAIAANRGEITHRQLFDFAPAVFQAATAGDTVAAAIVHRMADEVVSFVGALLRRMELTGSDPDVVLGGGTLQSRNALLLRRIEARVAAIAPKARLAVLDLPPVAGALASALTLAGAETAAVEKARAALR